MPKKRYNIWLDTLVIDEIKAAAARLGIKVSTYIRMSLLEKLRGTKDDKRQEDM